MASKLTWSPIRERTDGTPISEAELESFTYEVGVQPETGDPTPLVALPASLNSDNRYELLLADLPLERVDQYLAVRAIDGQGRTSDWSNLAFVALGARPNAPFDLRAE